MVQKSLLVMRQTEKILSIIIEVRSANCMERSFRRSLDNISHSSGNGKYHIVLALKWGRIIFYKNTKDRQYMKK